MDLVDNPELWSMSEGFIKLIENPDIAHEEIYNRILSANDQKFEALIINRQECEIIMQQYQEGLNDLESLNSS